MVIKYARVVDNTDIYDTCNVRYKTTAIYGFNTLGHL